MSGAFSNNHNKMDKYLKALYLYFAAAFFSGGNFSGGIHGEIRILDVPGTYRLVEGDPLSLTCQYTSPPNTAIDITKIRFKKDGGALSNEFRTDVNQESNKVTLKITYTQTEGVLKAHSGKYECIYETYNFAVTVDVFSVDTGMPVIPLAVPKSVVLTCIPDFLPRTGELLYVPTDHSILWLRGGSNVSEIIGLKERVEEETNRITINNVVRGDMGIYQCVFVFDKNSKVTKNVTLAAAPLIDTEKFSRFRNQFRPGDNWTIVCPVTGFPYPKVDWFKGDEPLNPAADSRIFVHSAGNIVNVVLQIYTLSFKDEGRYTCSVNASSYAHAYNFKSTRAEIQLIVKYRLAVLWPFLGIVTVVIILRIIHLLSM